MEISQIEKVISHCVYDNWFLSEPALHAVLCSHELRPNDQLVIPVRSGKGRIEYSPEIIGSLIELHQENLITQLFKVEMFRIMLKHPYLRQPDAPPQIRTQASNIVLTNNYDFSALGLDTAEESGLPKDEYFEWYVAKLLSNGNGSGGQGDGEGEGDDNNGDGDGGDKQDDQSQKQQESKNNKGAGTQSQGQDEEGEGEQKNQQGGSSQGDDGESDKQQDKATQQAQQSELWQEDDFQAYRVNEVIQSINSWGSVKGNIKEQIIASTRPRIDYRKVLSGFRASIISSRRNLTRMRPNRRTDFQNMGSVYRMTTRLLVAVDVSASISDYQISNFYGIINRFFKYGIETIDTVQFDTDLSEIVSLKKASQKIEVTGRGGTMFQPVFDLYAESQYDGLIILTDGFAAEPEIKGRKPHVVWIFPNKNDYARREDFIDRIGRSCYVELG